MKVKCPKCGFEFLVSDQKKQIIYTTLQPKPLRFNELHRLTKISKPYLQDLLVDMQTQHIVRREEISKQNVRFSIIQNCKEVEK